MPFLIWLNFSIVRSESSLVVVLDGLEPVVGEGVVFPALSISFWISLGQVQPMTINMPIQSTKERAFEFFIFSFPLLLFLHAKAIVFWNKKTVFHGNVQFKFRQLDYHRVGARLPERQQHVSHLTIVAIG